MMVDVSEKSMAFAAIAVALFATTVAFMVSSKSGTNPLFTTIIIAIGGLGAVATYALLSFGFRVMPFVTKFLGVSEVLGVGYRIPSSQDVVLRSDGGIYYATMYMSAKFYEATAGTEVDTEITPVHMELWERALSAINFPFKFSLVSYLDDLAKYREDLETKRATATLGIGKEHEKERPDALTVDKWEREISKLNRMLSRLSGGEKPMGVVMYAATTGVGVNEESAIAAAKKQVGEIRSTVANALNLEIRAVQGEDLKRCLRWEYIVPPDRKEFLASM